MRLALPLDRLYLVRGGTKRRVCLLFMRLNEGTKKKYESGEIEKILGSYLFRRGVVLSDFDFFCRLTFAWLERAPPNPERVQWCSGVPYIVQYRGGLASA